SFVARRDFSRRSFLFFKYTPLGQNTPNARTRRSPIVSPYLTIGSRARTVNGNVLTQGKGESVVPLVCGGNALDLDRGAGALPSTLFAGSWSWRTGTRFL